MLFTVAASTSRNHPNSRDEPTATKISPKGEAKASERGVFDSEGCWTDDHSS